jgi:phosphatidate cytidylyltransferase
MLRQRILSALVLGPVALAAAWFGGWAFVALVAVATALMGWEWSRMCHGRFGPGGWVLSGGCTLAVLLFTISPEFSLILVALAGVFAPLAERRPDRSPLWLAFGALYIGFPALSLLFVRELGRDFLFWLLLMVWATDIGAYAAGRIIGGPKLIPRISPKKTWAGLIGGMISAAAVGALVGPTSLASPLKFAVVSALLAVLAQAGDFGESWVKRRFGVKDSSNIIPGHGGVLDRVDGLLTVAPVVAVVLGVIMLYAFGEAWQ